MNTSGISSTRRSARRGGADALLRDVDGRALALSACVRGQCSRSSAKARTEIGESWQSSADAIVALAPRAVHAGHNSDRCACAPRCGGGPEGETTAIAPNSCSAIAGIAPGALHPWRTTAPRLCTKPAEATARRDTATVHRSLSNLGGGRGHRAPQPGDDRGLMRPRARHALAQRDDMLKVGGGGPSSRRRGTSDPSSARYRWLSEELSMLAIKSREHKEVFLRRDGTSER